MESEWAGHFERERGRYEDGESRLGGIGDPDERQRQLTRMGNAASGAGLALLMAGRPDEAADWLRRAADRYRESYPDAPPASWGRPIGAVKARVLAGDWVGAAADARWALDEGSAEAESPIGRYAGCLALLVLGEDDSATDVAISLENRTDFPADVADALLAIARHDAAAFGRAIAIVLASFEERDEHLEDIRVADTVIVLQSLARRRGLGSALRSALLPPA